MSVNDSDRAAAEALFRNLAKKNKLAAVFSLSVGDVAEHFARNREAERERIVRIIEAKQRQYAESAERSGFQTWRASADVMLQLAEELKSDQLTKEPSNENNRP